MAEGPLRDPWRGHDPKIESVVRLDDTCLGLRIKLSSGERMTMPLGRSSFHMHLDRRLTVPRKAAPPDG